MSKKIASLLLTICSPFNGQRIDTIRMDTEEQALHKLGRALALFKKRAGWLSIPDRVRILENAASLLKKHETYAAKLIAKEGGKPLVDAQIEVARAVEGIKIAGKELLRIMRGEEIPMGLTSATKNRKAFTTYEPIGVVVAISAFNHPLNLIIHQVIPAIAAGCPVLIKPASATPLSCLFLCDLLQKAGLPKGWCEPVICTNEIAQKLATDPRIGFFSFIGSAKVGWMLKSKLAPGVRCSLEHGGAAPVILDISADINAAITPLLKGGFYHAGQVCVSVQRIYVPAVKLKAFVKKLSEGAKKLRVGDPQKATTEVGPLISSKEVARVDAWVKEAVEAGAKLACGGKKLSSSLYAPTILVNPPDSAKVSTQEIFGPVVCIYSYKTIAEAITRANALDVAFQASVFAKDVDKAMQIANKLDTSAVMINDHTAFRADWMPFAGRRISGYGIGGIGYTMRDMLQHKMFVIKSEEL